MRAVTLLRNPKRFQMGVMRSRRMRAPARGALGRMSDAGVSLSTWRHAMNVAPTMPTAKSATPRSALPKSKWNWNGGKAYMVLKMVKMMAGSAKKPSASPAMPPAMHAVAE